MHVRCPVLGINAEPLTAESCRRTGVRECRRRFPTERLVLLWLGSSVGNSSQEEAIQFFRDVMAAAGQNSQARPSSYMTDKCRANAVLPDVSGRHNT